MPTSNSLHAQLIRQYEPYSYQRPFVQHSNYARPAQPAIQPNQLDKMNRGMGGANPWLNILQDYQNRTGIPAIGQPRIRQPRRMNWRLL
jgi:hypothetical protein